MSYFFQFCNYLHECHNELEAYLRDDPDAAEVLRTLDYGEGQEQNYDDPHIQQLYALRYMYAYAYEYREMFRRFLSTQELPGVIQLLSIGCGNGIDYWAIQEAQSDCAREDWKFVNYTGLDRARWRKCWGREYLDKLAGNVTYLSEDAVQFLQENPILKYNVILFPKSIGEFSEADFSEIFRAFSTARFQFVGKNGAVRQYNKIHILISLRKNQGIALDDIRRCDQLIEAMGQNGFVLEDAQAAEICAVEEGQHILDKDPTFFYPLDVWSFLLELNRQGISKVPITKLNFLCNRIMTFKREEDRA